MRGGVENGVSLMDGPRMMQFMFAAPPGSHHFSALLLKLWSRKEKQSATKRESSSRVWMDRDLQTHHLHSGCNFTRSHFDKFVFAPVTSKMTL